MKRITDKLRTLKTSFIEAHIQHKREHKRFKRFLKESTHSHYAITDSIALLNAEHWNALTKTAGFFMSLDYLKALEPVLPANISPRYALIYEKTEDHALKALAAVYMQVADICLTQLQPVDAEVQTKKHIRHTLQEKINQRVLVCGNLLIYGQHGIAFAEQTDQQLAWHSIAETLYRVRQADKLSGKTHFIMIKDLHEPFTSQSLMLKHLNYRYVETEPNMVLHIHPSWTCYEDYLSSLSSKYRANIKNGVIKPFNNENYSFEVLHEITPYQEHLYELYKGVHFNADTRPFTLRPEYFSALQNIAGARFRCTVIKCQQQVIGFLISLADGETTIAYHIGYDRQLKDIPLYQRLLHIGIADAIAFKAKRLSFGRTALEAKAALGAKPESFGVLVRHRQPVINHLIKRIVLGIEHDEAPERHPFKTKLPTNSTD